MSHIVIKRTSAYNECETCGGGSDDGGEITIDELS